MKPNEFVQYGLSCLEKFAALGDTCAKETRENIRVVVCTRCNIIMAPFFFLNRTYSSSAFLSRSYMFNFLVLQAAGGDGTVGWILGCLGELKRQNRDPVPPTGIIPLGTGNDLSRSFGWVRSY